MRQLMKYFSASFLFISMVITSSIAIAADYKVGFIYIGPPGDHGWNYQHDVGRKAVDDAFGDKVETFFQENVPESADAGERYLSSPLFEEIPEEMTDDEKKISLSTPNYQL